jgi:hypothetical protein
VTGEEALALAASHGVRVALALDDLLLEADHEPPAEAVVALRDHKKAVVAELRRIAAAAAEWRRLFERYVATVMHMRGLPRPEAERVAYEIVLVEFLNATHPNIDPNCCAHCRCPETPDATMLPIGVGPHVWLHSSCWAPWREGRRKAAIETLAAMGIGEPAP